MNAPVSIEPTLASAHRAAVEKVNSWRGRCVNLFACGERVVGQTLLYKEPTRKLPMLLGQKVERLTKLIAAEPKVARTLKKFQGFADIRNALVHGEGRVFVDGKSQWLIRLELTDRAGPALRTMDQNEGDKLYHDLKQVVDQLRSRLEPKKQTPVQAGMPSA